jgi:hypothetical protein
VVKSQEIYITRSNSLTSKKTGLCARGVIMTKNRSTIIFVMIIFLLALIPTTLGATSSTSKYQDAQWLKLVISQSKQFISDLEKVSTAAKQNNYEELYNAGKRLQVDTGKFLLQSKKYKVSPKLKNAKSEYEYALADFKLVGKYTMDLANKLKTKDINGMNVAYKNFTKYNNSGIKHLNKCSKYLKA